jgi:hypothetical protein
MAQLVREAMARLSAERETHLFTAGVSDDIFVKKLGKPNFEYVPRHVYFYYIRINTDGTLKVDHYEYFEPDPNFPTDPVKKWKEIPRTQAELEALTRRLVDNARPTGAQQGKTGSKFQGVIWDRRSYIIFFLMRKIGGSTENRLMDPVSSSSRKKARPSTSRIILSMTPSTLRLILERATPEALSHSSIMSRKTSMAMSWVTGFLPDRRRSRTFSSTCF